MPSVAKPKKPRRSPRALTNTEEKILRAVNDLHIVDSDAITRLLSANTARSHYGKLLTKLSGGADGREPSYLLKFRMPNAASIMASATPFFFCTTQKHLTVKSV
jgi:hypothetical protein